MPSNIAQLTASHNAIASKKRAKQGQIKEVIFDEDARREFLTGFHKRKLAKSEGARKKAQEREKQERQEARREQRRELRERAKANADQVEAAYGGVVGLDDEWNGIADNDANDDHVENEYEDDQVLATVTVVEDFDPTEQLRLPPVPQQPRRITTPQAMSIINTPKKVKPKKVKYETKAARKAQMIKQRTRRTEKAELAGGKPKGKRRASGRK